MTSILSLVEDFNVVSAETNVADFLNIYNLENLVKQKTCFKNPENPPCIDLILTNCPSSFQKQILLRQDSQIFTNCYCSKTAFTKAKTETDCS